MKTLLKNIAKGFENGRLILKKFQLTNLLKNVTWL